LRDDYERRYNPYNSQDYYGGYDRREIAGRDSGNRDIQNRDSGNRETRRRKKRRRGSALAAVLFVLCITLIVIVAMLTVALIRNKDKAVYEYVPMTEEASAKVYVWLSQIDGTELTYDEVKNCIGDFNLELVKTPTKEKGLYNRKLADGAYEYCLNQAQTGFEKAYKLSVMKRLKSSGYEGTITEQLVEELMMEAYEVSVADYLKGCNVDIFPSQQEIISRYEGEVRNEEVK